MSKKPNTAAQAPRKSPTQAWLTHHQQVANDALARIRERPLAQFLTLLAIGIVITLPSLLYVLFGGLTQLTADWQNSAKVMIFMELDTPDQANQQLARELRQRPDIARVDYVSAEQALSDYANKSGYGDLITALDKNPLPPTLIIEPASSFRQPGQVDALSLQLRELPRVDSVQVDVQWIRRLHAMASLLQRVAGVLAALLSLAVVLIIGNTIRLEIGNRKAEIEVMQLIGATHAFVRRPFLYTGLYYGLIGGGLAAMITSLATALINEPVRALADLYRVEYAIAGLGLSGSLFLIIATGFLGLLGAYLASSRHLTEQL